MAIEKINIIVKPRNPSFHSESKIEKKIFVTKQHQESGKCFLKEFKYNTVVEYLILVYILNQQLINHLLYIFEKLNCVWY